MSYFNKFYALSFLTATITLTTYSNGHATSLTLKVPPQTTTREIMPYCDTLCELDHKSSTGIVDNGMLQTGKKKVTCTCG